MTLTDDYGDEHEVTARIDPADGSRWVYYDADGYTPQQARALAAQLIAAADTLERRLLPLEGQR
jgi:hypothetical protein